MKDASATPPAEPMKACACCRETLPLLAFPDPTAKNCTACREKSAARRTAPKVPKPADWKAPKPGETPLRRCTACAAEKVWNAYSDGSDTCRQCTAGEPPPKADDAKRPTEYTPELGQATRGCRPSGSYRDGAWRMTTSPRPTP